MRQLKTSKRRVEDQKIDILLATFENAGFVRDFLEYRIYPGIDNFLGIVPFCNFFSNIVRPFKSKEIYSQEEW